MENEKKYYVRSVKFNESEYQQIERILIDENVTFSTLVRNRIFTSEQKIKDSYSKRNLKSSIEKLKSNWELVDQLKRIGNNLNQLTRLCHERRATDIMTLKEIDKIRKELERLEP